MKKNPNSQKPTPQKPADTEMKIYTPQQGTQDPASNSVADHAPVRIYERPFKPNQPTSPLG